MLVAPTRCPNTIASSTERTHSNSSTILGPGVRKALASAASCARARTMASEERCTNHLVGGRVEDSVIASEAKQSRARKSRADCFAEPVIGQRFAWTRWLALTSANENPSSAAALARCEIGRAHV